MKKREIILFACVVGVSLVVVEGAARQDEPKRAVASQASLEEPQRASAEKLRRTGVVLKAYAVDHDGRLPGTLGPEDLAKLAKLEPYVNSDDGKGIPLGLFWRAHLEYIAGGKTTKDLPGTAVVAYDRSLLQMTEGTNVLFADGHVEFVKADRLKALGIAPGQNLKVARGDNTYAVQLPEQWKPYVRAGRLAIVGSPFYGVRDKFFACWPHVRICWSFENLSSEPIELWVQYKSTSPYTGQTGHAIWYRLGPKEQRLIDDIIPLATAKAPVTIYVRAEELRHSGQKVESPSGHRLVTTNPVSCPDLPPNGLVAKDEKTTDLTVTHARLDRSQAQGDALELEVVNRSDRERPLVVYAAAGDAADKGVGTPQTGLFVEAAETMKPNGRSVIRLPYRVPDRGPDPSLVFTVLEPVTRTFPENGRPGIDELNPVCWGWFNLRQAAAQGLATAPAYVSVEERAKLTAQKQSKHFLFRYRAGSYAERHIDTAVAQREEAYQRLSAVLRMELPKTVTIDLYPDMEAKGLGSGTYINWSNTVTNSEIAEVYNENYQCDRYHELAHLFSYHFPGCESGLPGSDALIEPFAEYFETGTVQRIDGAKANLSDELAKGTLPPLAKVLLGGNRKSSRIPEVIFIDFLIRKDIDDFKKFFARVGQAKTSKDLEKASREVYGISLEELEQQWHKYLGTPGVHGLNSQ